MHSLNVPGMISIVVLLLIAGPSFPYSFISGGNVEGTPNVLDVPSTYVIATTANSTDPYRDAAEALALFRGGTVIEFSVDDLPSLMEGLKEMDARYVAVVVRPLEMDINFHRSFVMNSTTLDDDPFPDFSWGYITGATPADALSFVENIIRAEEEEAHLLPMKVSGYSASSLNWRVTGSNSFHKIVRDSEVHLYMEVNDTGSGRDFFLDNAADLEGSRMVTISGDGDPHMTWLFKGGNLDPDPPVWTYDPAKIEDPAHARMGLTPENLSGIDLYPAVVFAGTCHSGVPKRALVEGDIAATFGNTEGVVRFYEMSDDFAFFNRILGDNATGYFAPIGANHGYNSYFDQWNALRYHEPMGDIYKRSLDQVVMGFMGNSPNLRLYNEGESAYLPDILPSGDFDPVEWPSAAAMLGGKSNRVYYGDPMHDPFRNDHDPGLNLTRVEFERVDGATMELNISYHRPPSVDTWFPNWDMYHHGEDLFYEPIVLPHDYTDPLSVELVFEEQPSLGVFHVLERFDGETRLHIQASLPEVSMYDVTYYNLTIRLTRNPTFGVGSSASELKGIALPGESASYSFDVFNTGDIVDDIVLEHATPPQGWDLSLDLDGSDVPPGGSRAVEVIVRTPNGSMHHETFTALLSFTSASDPEKSVTVAIETEVGHLFGVRILEDDVHRNALPGDIVEIMITVENSGNGMDDITLDAAFVNWSGDIDFNGTGMVPAEKRAGAVTLLVPDDAAFGETDLVSLMASSSGNASDPLEVRISVGALHSLTVVHDEVRAFAKPGEMLSFAIPVVNTGNAPDELELVLKNRSGWEAVLFTEGASVLPGESWMLHLNISVPVDSLEGDTEQINVSCISAGDPSSRSDLGIHITVDRMPGFECHLPSNISALPGSTVEVEVEIVNTGNGLDEISVNVSSGSALVILSPNSTVRIGPGETKWHIFQVKLPRSMLLGSEEAVMLRAVSVVDGGPATYLSMKVSPERVSDLELTCDNTDVEVKSGSIAVFRLILENAGNGVVSASVYAGIECEVDPPSPVDMGPYSSRDLTLSVPTQDLAPGPHTIQVSASDGSSTSTILLKLNVVERDSNQRGLSPVLVVIAIILVLAVIIAGAAFVLKRRQETSIWEE
ncbi:MAG: hypothetical protein QCI82_04565 [Candidatus Thermoplasmatota archaeon]|nr:hypothetical protein [Candidatus Thermoplasmatota archaeon]